MLRLLNFLGTTIFVMLITWLVLILMVVLWPLVSIINLHNITDEDEGDEMRKFVTFFQIGLLCIVGLILSPIMPWPYDWLLSGIFLFGYIQWGIKQIRYVIYAIEP